MALGPQLTAVLQRYGLTELTNWAAEAIVQGKSEEQIMLEMYEQPAFRVRFAGIFVREDKGLAPISIDQYLEYEKIAGSLGSTWGLGLSKNEIDSLIGNDVSATELEQRFTIAASAIYESDPTVRSELNRLFNIGPDQLMRYWMDPKAELGTLQQQYRMGEIAGAALRSGFGQLSSSQASRLQQSGLTAEQAVSGFGQLAAMSELFQPIDMGETEITTDEQLGLLTGDADAAQAIEQRQARRKAEFEGAGGFASGQEGFATGKAD